MRGEYLFSKMDCATSLGSPPLARGIPVRKHSVRARVGITPACAGNTYCGVYDSGVKGDHPRLRGEYPSTWTTSPTGSGSPPLARGILSFPAFRFGLLGITPACAGNTRGCIPMQGGNKDHPRLRGEYLSYGDRQARQKGSPPLARGIPGLCLSSAPAAGITPACAGNTLKLHCFFQQTVGSPPLARGILHLEQ